jgi:hypothetical protein
MPRILHPGPAAATAANKTVPAQHTAHISPVLMHFLHNLHSMQRTQVSTTSTAPCPAELLLQQKLSHAV